MDLNPDTVKKANQAFYAKYPDRGNQPLKPGEPNFDALASEWAEIYEQQSATAPEPPEGNADTQGTSSTSAVQSCLESDPKVEFPSKDDPNSPPCDFDKLTIKCAHCAGKDRSIPNVQIWRESGKRKDNFQAIPPFSKRQPIRALQVLAGHASGKGDKISIQLEGGPGYCPKHPLIEVFSSIDGGLVLQQKGTSGEFEALTPKPSSQPAAGWDLLGFSVIWYHFFPPTRSAVYTILMSSCPNHPEGPSDTGLGTEALSVVTFPADEWKLSIDLKPNYSRSSSNKKLKGKGGTTETGSSSSETTSGWSSNGESTSKSETTLQNDSGTYSDKVEKWTTKDGTQTQTNASLVTGEDTDADNDKLGYEDTNHKGLIKDAGSKIKFTRNGASFGGTLNAEKLLNIVTEVNNAIQVAIRTVQNFQPKIGWSLELEYSILSGSMELSWGDKEYSDHTVYRSLAGSLNFDVVSGSITVEYGVRVGPSDDQTGAYLYGKASGKIFASGSVSGDPDQSFVMSGKVGGELAGEIGFKATLSGETAKFVGSVTFGIRGVGDVSGSPHQPPAIKCDLIRIAVEGTVRGEILWGLWHWEEKETFWEESIIKTVRFPEAAKDASPAPELVPG